MKAIKIILLTLFVLGVTMWAAGILTLTAPAAYLGNVFVICALFTALCVLPLNTSNE